MPLDKAAVDQLKADISVARKKELNFGFCLASKLENSAFETHRMKKPDLLGRAAKKKAGSAKLLFGTMNVDGRVLALKCIETPKDMMAKKIKAFLKTNGISMNVKLFDMTGNLLEDDDEVEDDQTENAPDQSEPNPAAEEWARKKEELEPQVRRFVSSPAGDASKVRAAWALATEAGDDQGDPQYALKIAKNIETLMAASGGAPDQKGEAPKDAEQRWLAARSKMEPHVLEALKLQTSVTTKISAVWAFANEKADGENADYGAAVKAMGPLAGLIAQARAENKSEAQSAADARKEEVDTEEEKRKAQCLAGIARIRPVIEDRLSKNLEGNDQLRKAWMVAQDKAENKEYATALELLKRIGAALKKEPVDTASEPEPSKLGAKALMFQEIDAAIKEVAAAREKVGKFPDTPSDDWTNALGDAHSALSGIEESAEELEIKAIILDAANKVEGVLADLGATLAERESWLKEVAVFEERMKILENHPMNATPPIGGGTGKIKEISDALGVAKTAATTERKYVAGKQELQRLRGLADKAEVYADELSHYTEIAKGRKLLFDALPGSATVGAHQSLVDALAKVKTLWAEAETKKTEGNFKDGLKKLNEMLTAHSDYVKLDTLHDKYNARRVKFRNDLDAVKVGIDALKTKAEAVEGANSSIEMGIHKVVETLEATYSDSTVDKMGYRGAHERMGRDLNILYRVLAPRKNAATPYVAALEKFDKAFTKAPLNLKNHEGVEGIREFVNLMERDLKDAKEAAAKFKFGLAQRLYLATEAKWAVWDQLAKDYKLYKDKYDVVNPKFNEAIKGEGFDSNTFFDGVDLADAMNAAEVAMVAKDYKRAKTELEAAEALITYYKSLRDKDTETKEVLKDSEAKFDKIEEDFDAAYKVFTDLRKLITDDDSDNIFASELQRADVEAKKAHDVKDSDDRDANQMATDLQAAIGILEPLVLKVQRAKAYKPALEKVEQEILDLKGLPVDQRPAAKDDWEAMEKLVEQAKEAVKSPGFDFQTGEALMNAAMRKARDARKKAELNPKIQALLDNSPGTKILIGYFKGVANGEVTFAKEIKVCEDYNKEVDDLRKAGDYEKAYEVAKTSKSQIMPLFKKKALYDEAVAEYTTKVGPMKVTFNGYDDIVKDQRKDKIAELEATYQTMMDAHDFVGAKRLCFNIKMEIWSCMGHQKTLDPWKAARQVAVDKIKELDDVKNDAVGDDLAELNKLLVAGDSKAQEFKYSEAIKIVTPISGAVAKLLVIADQYAKYQTSKTTAEQEILRLDGKEGIASLKDRIAAKKSNAEDRAAKKEYEGAKRLMDQIPEDVNKALSVNNQNVALNALSTEVSQLDVGDTPAVKQAVEKVRELVKQLASAPGNEFVLPRLVSVNNALKLAEEKAAQDGGETKKLLTAITQKCTELQADLWHFDQLKTIISRAEKRAETLEEDHTGKAHVAQDVANIRPRIAALATEAISTGQTQPGFAAAEIIFKDLVQISANRDAFKTYKDRADAYSVRFEALDKNTHRYAIKKALADMRQVLAGAAGDAAQSKYDDAQKKLDQVEALLLDSEIEVKLRNNEKPSAGQLATLMQREDGIKKLDAIVKGTGDADGLDEVTKREVLKEAFEARFGCKLVVANADLTHWATMGDKGPNLQRMYETMSLLPPTDTEVNDSLMEYWTSDQGGGSSFNGASKVAKVREGNTKYSWDYRFGDPYEVGDEIEPNCVPKNTDPVEALDWNTIHEVGHAVDDSQKYMEKNGKNLAGWEFHFGDFSPVAKAISKHYNYDYNYALAYISGNTDPPVPSAPQDVEPETWERNRIQLISHVDDCRNSRNPWMSASGAKKLIVKDGGTDRIYHEAYDGRWVSYDAAARKQAITGYQFRAPAEWFSELYAAYHCDKLGDQHPAVSWLEKISPKKKPE